MAMFPLGMVLLPSMVIPLHVFEPRYRQMTQDCLGGNREFGVVLIERGSEVGGGDTRSAVGTVARIIDAQEFPDGRWSLIAGGMRRIRVCRWLKDDPYPRAEVQEWLDPSESTSYESSNGNNTETSLAEVVSTWRRVSAMRAELGDPAAPATTDISDDFQTAVWQLAALSPIGPMDRQRVLATDGATSRLAILAEYLADEEETLQTRLQLG